MIDIELLRKEPDKFRESTRNRNYDPKIVDVFLALDDAWRKLTLEVETMRANQKKLGEQRKIEEAKQLKEKIASGNEKLALLEPKRKEALYQIPNLIHTDVPIGNDESENKPIRQWGTIPEFRFKPLDHIELGKKLDLIDIERAAKVSGSRFAYIKGAAALLQAALIQFVLDTLTSEKILKKIAKGYNPKPFIPIFPPVMIKPEPFMRMGRLSPQDADERYKMAQDDLYLVGSAEHTLGAMYMDEILKEEELPIRYIGYSTSFRREAGSYGKDTHGILRVHQFDKLEMESFTTPETSEKEHEFFVAIQEYLLQQLELPYQVVSICTGDMGRPDFKQTDIEVWMPGQNKYRETHTADYMTDYQSRRLNTKFKKSDGSIALVHTNDATAFAIGRTLVAILENYQTADATVKIPKVLQKYCGLKEIS